MGKLSLLRVVTLIVAISAYSALALLLWQRYIPHSFVTSVEGAGTLVDATAYDMPQQVSISIHEISVPVVSGDIVDGEWEKTDRGVSYLRSSTRPGEVGNALFYGHNWPNILGKLRLVRPGDEITVKTADGTQFLYTVAYVSVVTPDQLHIMNPRDEVGLTIYTCEGLFDEKRRVVYATISPS